ncbi:MAG: hypothetical protein EOP33_08580, partial [Rickettsiaceae bacterium]
MYLYFINFSMTSNYDLLKYIMDNKMKSGECAVLYMRNMSDWMNLAAFRGTKIDEATRVEIILNSLAEEYADFVIYFRGFGPDYKMTKFQSELLSWRDGLVEYAYHQVQPSLAPQPCPPSPEDLPLENVLVMERPSLIVIPDDDDISPESCEGNVPFTHLHVLEALYAGDSLSSWIIDSGTTNHVCTTLQVFDSWEELRGDELQLRVGNGESVTAKALGIVRLRFGNKYLILDSVYFIPGFCRNLISVSELLKQKFSLSVNEKTMSVSLDGRLICDALLYNGLYVLTPENKCSFNAEMFKVAKPTSNKKIKLSSDEQTYLWHLRLGHINIKRLERLSRLGPLKHLQVGTLPVCESCIEGKMTKRSFAGKGLRATEPLQLVHSDVCGPMSEAARGGYEYFVTFTDDYSRYGFIYLMQRKSETFSKFKEFRACVENQLGKTIKTFRSDRGGEFLDTEFTDYLLEHGIESQLSAPGNPQQNGVAERRNRTLLDMVRSMISYSSLSTSFWGYALKTAMYILNQVPSKSVSETPKVLWNGAPEGLRHFRIWGCPAHVLKKKSSKLEPRTNVCFFVGYPEGTKEGIFYDPIDRKTFVSTHATFLEDDYVKSHKPRSKIILEETVRPTPKTNVQGNPSPPTIVVRVGDEEENTNVGPSATLPRRSGRVSREPDRYLGFEANVVALDANDDDP